MADLKDEPDRYLVARLVEALHFYADPETYFAIAFLPDPPCGDFIEDFTETEDLGWKPGKLARETLSELVDELNRRWPVPGEEDDDSDDKAG